MLEQVISQLTLREVTFYLGHGRRNLEVLKNLTDFTDVEIVIGKKAAELIIQATFPIFCSLFSVRAIPNPILTSSMLV